MDIVVGVDGSPSSDAALAWAVGEAAARGQRLVALLAWDYLDQPHLPDEETFDPEYSPEEAARVLDGIVDRVLADLDDVGEVEIERRVVLDHPAKALLDAAADAALVVVGSRGRGGFAGLLLGSVSQEVVEHASCPVLVHHGPS